MTDNVTANSGSGGPVFATDDIGGVHYPISKLAHGVLDSATLVSSTNPLPTTGGTQYTEGDTDASITGTAIMLEAAANTLIAAPGTTADGLLVNLGSNNDVVISDGGNTITVDNGGTFATQITPATSGGLTTYHLVSAATTNATVVKNSAGQLFGWYIKNNNASTAKKVSFHNASSTPTAGASIFFSIDLPAGSAANVFSEIGIPFSTGISITTTVGGGADSDSTAVALNDLNINLWYK